VQADPKTYAKYAAAPQTADALAKLQRFHALVKANGGTTVSVSQLLCEGDPKATAVSANSILLHRCACSPSQTGILPCA
jgi:hypothetical protein